MTRRRVLNPLLLVAATIAALALVAGSCGGDDDEPAAASSTTAAEQGGGGHDGSHGGDQDSAYGAHAGMAPEIVTAARIGELGAGPAVGQTFTGHVGLNVCGRFLSPPPAASDPATGVSTDGEGRFAVTPPTEEVAGRAATFGELAATIGLDLGDGSVRFPADVTPGQIDVGGTNIAVAGRSFGPDFTCGGTATEVQLWVYTADAVATGDAVRAVVEDPAAVPIVEDGMAFVVAVTPESSLPTLPPSAALG
jgi:hypothetical protein